jgi:hypothetical protein
MLDANAVPLSDDLLRVLALPVRDWFETEAGQRAAAQLAVWLTDQLRTSATCDRCGGAREHASTCGYRLHERPPLALRPVQAVLLWEFYQMRGAVGQIPVGGGKSLITFLAAFLIGALRPVLFLPANLVRDTWTKFELYDRYWKRPNPIPNVLSFSAITQKKNVNLLFDLNSDCLMGDECQKAKDERRSTRKRIERYISSVNYQDSSGRLVINCANMWLSATTARLSITDDAHYATWALGPRAPVPKTDKALQEWSMALDEERRVGEGRLWPGELMRFADMFSVPLVDPDLPMIGQLERAREGYRKRYAATPGIIVYDGRECEQPLSIDFVRPPEDPKLEEAFARFRNTFETPDGILLADPLARDRHEGQLGCGFFYYWDPRPPAKWLAARYDWNCFVRDEIENSARTSKPLDTEMAVAQAYPDNEYLLRWREVKGLFDPLKNTAVQFISYSVVQFAAEQGLAAERAGAPAICWVKHHAFAMALAQLTGWRYYAEGGEQVDTYGRTVKDATIELMLRDYVGRQPPPVILSIDSNMLGRNLQAYCNNLNVGWEQAGPRAEQRLGRTHRSGQDRPVHDRTILLSARTIRGFDNTYSEAQFVKSARGLTQKILTATVDRRELDRFDGSYRYSVG